MSNGQMNAQSGPFDEPKSTWRPLRRGVLEFQFTPSLPDVGSAELIQHLCNQAARYFPDVEINYEPEEQLFEIDMLHRQLGTPTYTFKLSDLTNHAGLADLTVRADPGQALWASVGPELRAIQAAILLRLEASIRLQVARRRVKLFARLHSPLSSSFCEIPSDVVDYFSIADWRLGSAIGPNRELLFSVHLEKIEPSSEDQQTPSRREALRIDRRKSAKFALFLLENYQGSRPSGKTWDELAQEFLNHSGTPKGTIDKKTMQTGVSFADAVNREESGIPG